MTDMTKQLLVAHHVDETHLARLGRMEASGTWVEGCRECAYLALDPCYGGPRHKGSSRCESNGLSDLNPEGRSHCSCDTCF
mgnify:CR=1 FL=1